MNTLIITNQLYVEVSSIGGPDSNPCINRVCAVFAENNEIVLFDVRQANQWPRLNSLSKFRERVDKGELRVLTEDFLAVPPGNESSQNHGQNAFKTINSIVTYHVRELCVKAQRTPLLLQASAEFKCSKATIKTRLRLYFRGDMTSAALQGNYRNCGARGESRTSEKQLLGRPNSNEKLNSPVFRMNVTEKIAKQMQEVWATHSTQGFEEAYTHFLDYHFTVSYRMEQGKYVPVHATCRPTPRQFEYHVLEKPKARRISAALRLTERQFQLESRKHGATPHLAKIYGPGHEFQLDGTGGLVHLVASINLGREIGKAKIYFAVDTYSRAVVGYAVVLENYCSSALAVVLECAFSNKVEHCASLGITITEAEWPMCIVPNNVLGDGGPELMGFTAEYYLHNFKFGWNTTPVGRADFKDAVERQHGHMKDENENLDGAARHLIGRCERNPRQDACLTKLDFEKIIVHYILFFNSHHKCKDHPDAIYLLSLGLEPTPLNLWNWGLVNRSGAGRHFDKTTIFERLLLPAEGSVGAQGIEFFGLAWQSKIVDNNLENLRLPGFKKAKVKIGYKKESVARIYLLGERNEIIETCEVAPKFSHFSNLSFWEIEEQRNAKAPITRAADHAKYEAKSALMHTKINIVETAKENQIAAGVDKVSFSQYARDLEKQVERQVRAQKYEEYAPAPLRSSSEISAPLFGSFSYDEELDGDLSK